MLFDPKWEVKSKPDAFSLESLIAWLEKQPADKTYDWSDAELCLLGQWAAYNGCEDPSDKSIELGEDDGSPFFKIALGNTRDCTFGAALTRARAALR